jgi:spermidine synthase
MTSASEADPGERPNAVLQRYVTILYVLFFMSGATGLIYEIMWNRKLTLIFGATVYAVTTILTVFFTGLALGAYLIGRHVDRSRNPLRLYVALEVAIGLFGICSPLLFKGVEWIYALVHPLIGGGLVSLTSLRFVLSFLGLLIPTTLLGATLPVLVKLVVRSDQGVARNAGRLYAVNSVGAAFGTLLATTALIQLFGVNGSLYLAGSINIAIALAAWLLFGAQSQAAAEPPKPTSYARDWDARYVIGIFGFVGFVSMAYQVAWFRLLIQITGTSVYSFGIMLSVFIVGIGLGSAIATRLLPSVRSAVVALIIVELVASGYTLFGIGYFDQLPALYVGLFGSLAALGGDLVDPFVIVLLSKASIAAIVFLVPTLMFGAAFPLVAKIYAQRAAASGRDVGIIYAANTVGGVLGSFLGGFVILPFVGTQVTIVAMSVAGVLIAVAIAIPLAQGLTRQVTAFVSACLALQAFFFFSPWNPLLIDAGPYWLQYPNAEAMIQGQLDKHLHYYREGVNVNVSVTGTEEEVDTITINGKPMATTILPDVANQYLLGHLPMLLHPDPQDSVVIGLGAGMTFGALVRHGNAADVVEISPEIVEGTRLFAKYNRSVLDQPNANVIFDDGRNYLMTTRKKYDVITEDPLDPFFMGSGYLYDLEHFENARRALKPGGIMCQYLPLYQLGVEETRIIMKTFNEVFPYVTVWFAFNDILLIGTEEPLKVDYDLLRRRVQQPEIARDLREIGIDNEFDFLANYLFDQSQIPEIGDQLPVNTDDYPIIEFLAPRSFMRTTETENLLYYLNFRADEPPDLIEESALSATLADQVRGRFEQYYQARSHVMRAHIGRLGQGDIPWLEEAYAAERRASPFPIATAYLAALHRIAASDAMTNNQYQFAIREYQRSLELDPDDIHSLNNAGYLLWQTGRREEALRLLQHSYDLDADQIYPLPFLADALIAQGQLRLAEEYLDRCLRMDEDFTPCVDQRKSLQVLMRGIN